LTVISLTFLLPEDIVEITSEDGLVENAQVLFYLAAAGMQLYMSCYLIRRYRILGFYHLLLFGLFFFVAMEEISWGQRIFSWKSPPFFWEHNFQRETNIHNLWDGMYSFSNIVLMLFIGSYCILIPLTKHASGRIRRLIDRFHLPTVDLNLVSIFIMAGLIHSAPIDLVGILFTVIVFMFPMLLLLSGVASYFFKGFERPLLQVTSIAIVGVGTIMVWGYGPAYQSWLRQVAFELRELILAIGFFSFTLILLKARGNAGPSQNLP
jgi:hypothetical protein